MRHWISLNWWWESFNVSFLFLLLSGLFLILMTSSQFRFYFQYCFDSILFSKLECSRWKYSACILSISLLHWAIIFFNSISRWNKQNCINLLWLWKWYLFRAEADRFVILPKDRVLRKIVLQNWWRHSFLGRRSRRNGPIPIKFRWVVTGPIMCQYHLTLILKHCGVKWKNLLFCFLRSRNDVHLMC